MLCYCNSELAFSQCCEPIINGQLLAPTPEALMRSRYSAYCVGNADYIHQSYADSKKAENSISDIAAFAKHCDFIRLEVLDSVISKNTGEVEFKAHYLADNCHYTLHERSNFILENEQWRYLDGFLFDTPIIKLGRNDPCPCGSQKKYKKCHGK